jgi:hypothetical protein
LDGYLIRTSDAEVFGGFCVKEFGSLGFGACRLTWDVVERDRGCFVRHC